MRRLLSLKGAAVLALVLAMLAGGATYATHRIFEVSITAEVQLNISTEDPLGIFSGDGTTPIVSGDALKFGTVELDFWGTGPVPVKKVLVVNTSQTPERVVVAGDGGDGVVPVFGPTPEGLKAAPENAFVLQPQGISGDKMWGYLGLTFPVPTTGSKSVTITFRATDVVEPLPPRTGRIAFVSARDGNNEIYTMDADGSNQTRLTDDPMDDFHPAWSPDGFKIAFTRFTGPFSHIYVMDADGSNQTRITDDEAFDWGPAWSPDGGMIAFSSGRDRNNEIYVMDADGSNLARITNDPAEDRYPSWSTDGGRIGFQTDRHGNWEVYAMGTDGSNPTRLTDDPASDWYPDWSPDGTRIAFVSDRDGNDEIYVMKADGSDQVRLTDTASYERWPRWSPDGESIAFYSDRDGNSEIYVMDADGSNPVRLTNNPAADWAPDWAPGAVEPPPPPVAFPPLPIIYDGKVSIQGQEAPEGLSLFACVQGCASYRSDQVTIGPGGEYRVLVVGPPNESFLNKEITFWIENEFGRIKATQTAIFRVPSDPKDLTPRLNLEFSDPLPEPPPPPTPTNSPADGD